VCYVFLVLCINSALIVLNIYFLFRDYFRYYSSFDKNIYLKFFHIAIFKITHIMCSMNAIYIIVKLYLNIGEQHYANY